MRGAYIDPFIAAGFEPAGWNAATGKDKRVGSLLVDHCQFEIDVVGRIVDGLPFHYRMIGRSLTGFLDRHQGARPWLARAATGRLPR